MMQLLFVGEAWRGSCARSLHEALTRCRQVDVEDIAEDAWFTKPQARWLRALNRVTTPAVRREFNRHVLDCVRATQPDAVIVYKGFPVHADLVKAIRATGTLAVNVYPDFSPHAYGGVHREAVGSYDLVVSTKAYHPALWQSTYGYHNRCLFVPQGYDPTLHLYSEPPKVQAFDVVLVATFRAEYGRLMTDLARALPDPSLRVAIGGNGWDAVRAQLPAHWQLLGGLSGRRYVETLRSGKICVAPLTRNVVIDGQRQPGDVDSTRTYELAAAWCFFVHRRTDYVQTLYDEAREVPMFDGAEELAQHIRYYRARPDERTTMAAAAHARAVPCYSLDQRATQIVAAIANLQRNAR